MTAWHYALTRAVPLRCPLRAWHADAGGWRQQAEGTALALTLGHAVTSYLSGVPWLAKDIVWVLPDARCGLLESAEVNLCLDMMTHLLAQPTGVPSTK